MIIGFLGSCFVLLFISFTTNDKQLNPPKFFAGIFALIFFSQLILTNNMVESTLSSFVIIIFEVCFLIGYLIGSLLLFSKNKILLPDINHIRKNLSKRKFILILILILIFTLYGSIIYANAMGVLKLTTLFSDGGERREALMFGNIDILYTSRFAFISCYTLLFLAVIYYICFSSYIFICFSLIPIIILGLAQSGRAGLIYSILTILIGLYINFLVRNKANIKFLLLYVIILSVFILLIFILGRIHRYGLNFDLITLLDSVNSVTSYTFGGISGFANYIDLKIYESNLTFGSYAFSGLYQFLGLSIQEPGLYNEYVPIDQSGNVTNLYTGFRPFIDDFGFIGAFSFFSFFGFLSNIFYSKFMAGYLQFLGPLIWIYLWIMLLPFVTITIFNSYLAALFLPFILIKFCLKK